MSAVLETPTIAMARECLYRFFGLVLSDSRSADWSEIRLPESRCLIEASCDLLREEAENDSVALGFGERPADDLVLHDVLQQLGDPDRDVTGEFDRVFGLVTIRECPPYESEYCATEDPFFRAQQIADAAGFYRAFGLVGGRDRPDRVDHIALEFHFMAHLLMMARMTDDDDQSAICDDAARRFFRDHLAWWVPSFASGLRRRADGTLYAEVAATLAAFIAAERARLGIPAPQSPVRPRGIALPVEEPEGCASCAAGP
jgi:TorA maturation chaperone TorD